ncbi:DNA alkylation repair protein [Chitinophagaceae bacterium LB-8]|uniref:DNA alkylation repair protein n=1 Tax=Paraflavisolibacter caeni TaxID=2982496 RepID=A0A9X2XX89_9BACT|nr:DNA alkylation repair protein [Paraflavisolibacter caeni]MCU7550362.1 DNA alkylation repair protein [Paraflavisolibacter caeni]
MTVQEILQTLQQHSNFVNIQGMSRYGINTEKAFGIKIPILRQLAKSIGKNHPLALELWKSEFHEARLLAIFIADPKQVDETLMEQWVLDFNSWDICDQCCSNLFERTPFAFQKALEWVDRNEEFVKRAGFVLIAVLAVHRKKLNDQEFLPFFSCIEEKSDDERNFVKKAVNWALRQLGKRSSLLRDRAIEVCERLKVRDSKSARWIATDALRELKSEKKQKKIVKLADTK